MAAGGPKRRLVAFVVEPDPDDPADVIGDEPVWHDGEVVGWVTSGGYGHHVKRVDRARATCRPSWRRRTARAAAASRSRSSAGAGRRGSSPSRCSTRRACGCASDRGARVDAAGEARRIVVDGRPVAFEAGDSVARRDPAGRRGARPRRHALPGRRLRQLPRRGRRRRVRADVPGAARPGLAVVRHPAGGDCRRCPSSTGRTRSRRRVGAEIEVGAPRSDVVVIGGGASGPRGRATPSAAGETRWSSTPATATRSSASTRARRSSPGRPTGDAPRRRRARSSSRPGAAEIQPVCPGNDLAGLAHGPRRRAPARRRRGARRASSPIGTPPAGVPCTASPGGSSGSRATPAGVRRRRHRRRRDRRRDDDAVRHRRSSVSAWRRATSWPGWPATVPGRAWSATRPTSSRCRRRRPTGAVVCRCIGHDRRRPRRRVGPRLPPSSSCSSGRRLAGIGTCQGGACLPHVRAWIARPDRRRSRTRSRPGPASRQITLAEAAADADDRRLPADAAPRRAPRARRAGWTGSAAGGGRGTTATPSPSTGRSARASRSAT